MRFVGVAVMVVALNGCLMLQSATRYANAPGTVSEPFWCNPSGGTALSPSECTQLSIELDFASFIAGALFTASSATAAGATSSPYHAGVGAPFRFRAPTSTFDYRQPDTLLYDDTAPTAQVAGIEYNIAAASAPAGFTGLNDVWTDIGGGVWRLRVWILRPFQNEVNVFADSHPCLDTSGPIYDVTNTCYTSTHPNPLQILVTNDDGFNAAGIDAIVEGLRALPAPAVHVTVSAPASNQSGSGSSSTNGPLTATDEHTLSGYAAWAVDRYPVDAVRYALFTQHVNPDLVVSGSNIGQNLGSFISISGTVGAAREAASRSIPAVGISQGLGSPPNFPESVTALKSWLNDFLYGRTGRPFFEPVTNINVPTCTAGSIRGTVKVPPATTFAGGLDPSDCTSTVTSVPDDITAFKNGYITVSQISAKPGSGS
jgi:5'-nucleotidase